MPARFRTKDRVLETSVTTGAGTYTLAGAATGFQAFRGGDVAANDQVPYYAEDGTNWEAGIGTVLSGPDRLQRDTILSSSNGGAAVNWGAGTRNLRCGWPAELNTPRYKSVSIAGGAGTQVLTQDEQRCDILVLTGAITGNRVIEVDTAPWRWIVFNNTSGAFTVTLKVTGQTGVAIAQGKSKLLYCDGTDVEDGNTDVTVAAASETVSGIAELATQSETDTGTDDARIVTPLKLKTTPRITLGTEVASTSGTAIDFTSIPTGVRRIVINLVGVSTNGTSNLRVQIGDSGGVETSGYLAGAGNNGGGFVESTAGFIHTANTMVAASTYHGSIVLSLEDSAQFTWVASGNVYGSGSVMNFSAGSKSLSAELDRVRITTVSGDTFDAGAINISYER